jgi:hypothetical protein
MASKATARTAQLFLTSLALAVAGCAADAAALSETTPAGPIEEPPEQPSTPEPADVPDYDFVYDTTKVQRYDIELSDASWATLLADPLADEYVEGTLRVGDEVVSPVGVRFKGNSSRWSTAEAGNNRFSYKIKLNEFVDGQSFHGIKTLNLHNAFKDPSFMRERLSYDLFREAGVPASRVGYVDLYVNGEHVGLYVNVEQVDKTFLASWFGDKSGNLYKPEKGDLVYKGDTIEAYGDAEAYELKTNEDAADYSGLLNLIDVLNNTADADLPVALETVLDVDMFIKWLALNTLLVSLDSYAGPWAHNFYLYDNPTTGRFVFIPWDYNESFGRFTCELRAEQLVRFDIDAPYCKNAMGAPAAGTASDESQRPLITRILAQAEYRELYHQRLQEYATGSFASAPMTAAMAKWRALISDYVAADPTKFGTFEEFEAAATTGTNPLESIPTFVEERDLAVLAMLDGTFAVICGDGICDRNELCEEDCARDTTYPTDCREDHRACKPGQGCDQASGNCTGDAFESCSESGTCDSGFVCIVGPNLCAPDCTVEGQPCPGGMVCDESTGMCGGGNTFEACSESGTCDSGFVCVPGPNVCAPDCRISGNDCPSGNPTCSQSTGLCS